LATLDIKDLAVVDQPNYPDRSPTTPGTLSLRVIWRATNEKDLFSDPCKQFAVNAYHAEAQAQFSVVVPSLDFIWKSDPIETSRADFAIIGEEVNGRYFSPRMPELVGLNEAQAQALLGNLSITNTKVEFEGYETLGNSYKHDRHAAIVTRTTPIAGTPVDSDSLVVLHVRGKR
jgi:hypothetical protein